jgi:hypothetical protein
MLQFMTRARRPQWMAGIEVVDYIRIGSEIPVVKSCNPENKEGPSVSVRSSVSVSVRSPVSVLVRSPVSVLVRIPHMTDYGHMHTLRLKHQSY